MTSPPATAIDWPCTDSDPGKTVTRLCGRLHLALQDKTALRIAGCQGSRRAL